MRLLPTRQQAAIAGNGAAIRVENVWAGYSGHTALEGVDFEVPRASMVGLVGPNGSGKSTLIKVILGMHRPWRGRVQLLGRDVRAARRLIGYTPQTEMVDWQFPVTVRDVVTMGRYGRLGLLRWPTGADREVVERCLDRLQLMDLAKRQIGELSGGQQRRVLIARALAQEPEVLLLDEPMAGLDATIQHELLSLFEELRAEGKTLLVATHDLSCVTCCFDRALLLNRRMIAYGDPTKVFTQELLNEAFKSHLIILPVEGSFHVEHHGHE
ncbi:MAG: metal ABC transporter ATP-binding protein [Dehalococcoidia bacterium]|jgi:ABC-type Mn2+/Zn2+ transport system ATPase subunit